MLLITAVVGAVVVANVDSERKGGVRAESLGFLLTFAIAPYLLATIGLWFGRIGTTMFWIVGACACLVAVWALYLLVLAATGKNEFASEMGLVISSFLALPFAISACCLSVTYRCCEWVAAKRRSVPANTEPDDATW